jgi:hypothetical protein
LSNISLIGTHDSAFVGELPQDNQGVQLTAQLDAGVRFLQGQTHVNAFGLLSMCHTDCFLLDAGTLQGYLTTVKGWLDKHPNEVVTLLLTNGDNVDVSMFDTSFKNSGIQKYVYTPPSSPVSYNAWPTLQKMISANTRLVVFLGPFTHPSLLAIPTLQGT